MEDGTMTTVEQTQGLHTSVRAAVGALRRARRRWSAMHPESPAGTVDLLATIAAMSRRAQAGDGDCRLKDLAAAMGLDPSTVSREVSGLMAAGLVARHPDPRDGRAAVLALTDAGQDRLTQAHELFTRQIDDALAGWSPEEARRFGADLSRFAHDLSHYLQETTR